MAMVWTVAALFYPQYARGRKECDQSAAEIVGLASDGHLTGKVLEAQTPVSIG